LVKTAANELRDKAVKERNGLRNADKVLVVVTAQLKEREDELENVLE
jgi:hypothetical protein